MIGFNVERESVIREVKARLSEKRFEHTLGVCDMAEHICSYCLPEDREEVFFAALLHDIAKELTECELKDILAKEGITLTEDEKNTFFDRYVKKYAESYKYSEEYVRAELTELVYDSMLYDKTVEFLIIHNSFVE